MTHFENLSRGDSHNRLVEEKSFYYEAVVLMRNGVHTYIFFVLNIFMKLLGYQLLQHSENTHWECNIFQSSYWSHHML